MAWRGVCGVLALLLALHAPAAFAREIALPRPLSAEPDALPAVMAQVAAKAIAEDHEPDRGKRLDDLFRLQIVAGRYADAQATLAELNALRRAKGERQPELLNRRWEIYARARLAEGQGRQGFADAFSREADATLRGLDAKTAYKFLFTLGTPLDYLEKTLADGLAAQAGKTSLDLPSALDLVRRYLSASAYRRFHPLLPAIGEADDRRRYLIDKDILVPTPDGARVCVLVVRPRGAAGPLPTLLNFTIYYDPPIKADDARRTAAEGYAAVIGLTRGKACSPDRPVPIEHDGADAATVVDWIARQPWSDGRVGMFGGSYEGFVQWATAKRLPKALKAIMPSVSFSPGTDFPMEGNVFATYGYPWPLYTTDNKTLDDQTYFDSARWERQRRTWYVSGRAYRDLDRIDGSSNPIWDGWLDHPAYDAYWRGLVPSAQDYARIGIPVLTTTGYYDSGQIGALSYFLGAERYNPTAAHYLVIGPYDHIRGQRGTVDPLGGTRPSLRGYDLDPVAQLDIIDLRYRWFDYIFRGAPKPPILRDRVNYEVMGANLWKHAPSVAAMASRSERFYLAGRALSPRRPGPGTAVLQMVDLADRSDVDRFAPRGPLIDQSLDDWPIVDKATNLANSVMFLSAPFGQPPEISGLFSGELALVADKRDFDVAVTLFEVTAKGEYFQLSYCWQRASYAKDRGRRQLLVPGQPTRLPIRAGRLTSRRFQPGSRLAVVISVIKQPGEQINYGTGKDVSDETVKDAGAPLTIRWLGSGFIDVPIADPRGGTAK